MILSMNIVYVLLHVLFLCNHCDGIYGYSSQTTNHYKAKGTSVISPVWNGTVSGVDYDSSYTEQVIGHTQNEIDRYLNLDITIQFLSQYPHEYQRDVLRKQLKHCPYTRLCGFSFNLTQNSLSCCMDCSCNISSCVEYKTCCPDILFTYVNKLNPSSDIQDLPKLIRKQTTQKDCIPLHLSKTMNYNTLGAYGFSSCPIGTDKELQTKCSRAYYYADDNFEIEDLFPVIHKETNELYRNKYCAFCYNISRNNIQQLTANLNCNGHVNMTADKEMSHVFDNGDVCHVEFELESLALQLCRTAKHDCNITGTFSEAACSIYKTPIFVDDIFFQNIFCSFCNSIWNTSLTCTATEHESASGFPFSGLMNVGPPRGKVSRDKIKVECDNYQLYDSITNACKNMWCSAITKLKDGQCIEWVGGLTNQSYALFLRMKPVDWLIGSDALVVIDQVVSFMTKFLEDGKLCEFKVIIQSNMSLNTQDANVTYIDALVRYVVTVSHNPYTIVTQLFTLHKLIHLFLINGTNKLLPLKFQLIDDVEDTLQSIDLFHLPVLTGELNVLDNLPSHNPNCEFHMLDLNVLELTKCPKVAISKMDVPWRKIEDEIIFLSGSFRLTRFEYFFFSEYHIGICADSYKQYLSVISKSRQISSSLSTESVISISIIALSILALCVALFIYCFLPQLRQSLPGKNNLSLITSLLCAQCLYLFGSFAALEKYPTACFIIGLFVHFSWLVALLWMNICTYHMFCVLAKTRVISSSSGMKRMLFYHLYAVSVAIIFVCLNVGLSHATNGDYGYGGDACYISSQRMLIFTFGIPATSIVLCNFFMFIIVMIQIKRSPSVEKNVKNERNDIIIFAKLSTITGATWIFGIIYMFTTSIYISYIFIVLNASQGIFIMISFIVNRRVYNMLKEKAFGLNVSTSGSRQTTIHTM